MSLDPGDKVLQQLANAGRGAALQRAEQRDHAPGPLHPGPAHCPYLPPRCGRRLCDQSPGQARERGTRFIPSFLKSLLGGNITSLCSLVFLLRVFKVIVLRDFHRAISQRLYHRSIGSKMFWFSYRRHTIYLSGVCCERYFHYIYLIK